MIQFPGKLKHGGRNGKKILLSHKQVKWMNDFFPMTENRLIADAMGINVRTVSGVARRYGISKSEEGMRQIRKRQQEAALKTNLENGCYDRKRGRPVSEATCIGRAERWRRIKEGEIEGPIDKYKREHQSEYQQMLKANGRKLSESYRKEKLRKVYGMDLKTNLRITVKSFTKSQSQRRYRALCRGYLLAEDCSEGSPWRYVIFYNDDTQRAEKFEQNCINDGFTIMKDE